MENPLDQSIEDEHIGPERQDEASLRAALELSRQDIVAGRIKALEPVLNRMRAIADQIRRERADKN